MIGKEVKAKTNKGYLGNKCHSLRYGQEDKKHLNSGFW